MKDLSNLAPSPEFQLNGGESMSAGNTISDVAANVSMTSPGSQPVDPPPADGNKTDTPGLGVSGKVSHDGVLTKGNDSIATGNSWKKAGE